MGKAAKPPAVDPAKFELAKKGAQLFAAQTSAFPPEVQLMAADMLVKATFMTVVKAERRLQLFDTFVRSMREEIKADLKKRGGA